MRSERKVRISGLAGTEHARNRTLPDLTCPVTEIWVRDHLVAVSPPPPGLRKTSRCISLGP